MNSLIDNVIETCFSKMLDDFRINRFFNSNPIKQQTAALKSYVDIVINQKPLNDDQTLELLNEFFQEAFARNNHKPSLVTGNDFGFLLDLVGGQEIRPITLLCENHSFLIKLLPDDSHYDAFLDNLNETLKELQVDAELKSRLLKLADQARDGILARGRTYMKAA